MSKYKFGDVCKNVYGNYVLQLDDDKWVYLTHIASGFTHAPQNREHISSFRAVKLDSDAKACINIAELFAKVANNET